MIRGRLLLLLLVVSPGVAQDEPPAPTGDDLSRDVTLQPFRRAVALAPTDQNRWIEIRADLALLAASAPELADVRVVNDDGVPYPSIVLSPSLEDATFTTLATHALRFSADVDGPASGAVPLPASRTGNDLVVVVHGVVDLVRLQGRTTNGTWDDLRTTAPPELRASSHHPRSPGVPIGERSLVAHLGASPHDEIRVVSQGPTPPPDPTEIEILSRRPRSLPADEIPLVKRDAGYQGRLWIATFDVAGPPRPLARVVLDGDATLPHLRTDVTLRPPERAVWQGVAMTDGDPARPTWTPTWSSAIRLHVEGGSPPSAPVRVVRADAAPVRIGFRLPAHERAWVVYGDPHSDAPGWEFDPLEIRRSEPVVAHLGDPEPSPWHEPPRAGLEWTRRHPEVITGVMIGLLVLLAAMVLRWHPRTVRPSTDGRD
jgi:hypothetical protein